MSAIGVCKSNLSGSAGAKNLDLVQLLVLIAGEAAPPVKLSPALAPFGVEKVNISDFEFVIQKYFVAPLLFQF